MAGDPRVYFAAERTLLAWLRTGLTVMALGFVVARFGLLYQLLPVEGERGQPSMLSSYLGATMVAVGIASIVAGALEFRRYCRLLSAHDLPSPRAPRLPLGLAWALVALGALLVVLLLT